MIHLIWSILNAIIVLYFLYLIIGFIRKGTKILKPPFKFISIFVMVIGIVQIIAASDSEKNSNRISITEKYESKNNSVLKLVQLEDNWTFDIQMLVTYSIEQDQYIPIESNSFLTGLVSGYEWEFKAINTNNLNINGTTEFNATGILKWNLFGIPVYSESKTFQGIIE